MESLAYLHLAVAYEAPENIKPVPILKSRKLFEGFNWRKLSGIAWMYWLSVAVALAVLGMATQALATLELGLSGPEVTDVQERLQKLGYFKANVTGYFGPLTKEAIIQFQKDKGLTANGVVDSETEAALRDRKKPLPIPIPIAVAQSSEDNLLEQGGRGQAVQALQENLKASGFYSGPLNGVFDEKTAAAVMAFQKAKGLTVDGIVGPQTRAKLSPAVSGSKQNVAPQIRDFAFLKLGDNGVQVANLQRRLRELGYYKGRMSGYFDQDTQQAVVKFQKEQILPAYGTVGPKTFAALDNVTSRSSLEALQRRLKAKGFYQGPIDGVLNAQTKAAIAAAQEAYGVKADDIMKKRL